MSFNPVLVRTHTPTGPETLAPLCENGERLLLMRDRCSLKMTVAGKNYTGSGIAFLTSRRVVFLKEGTIESHKNWSSCEFPLKNVFNNQTRGQVPEFNQPILGSNNLTWGCEANHTAQYPFEATANVKLSFKDSCYTFVKLFLLVVDHAAKHGGDATSGAAQILQGVQAFVDQADPSRIFFQQPYQQPQLYAQSPGSAPQQIPQQSGYAPPQGGYTPQQGYVPQQGGYIPQQGGYVPQQGYAPYQGGGGYGYTPGGYTPQQLPPAGYPPQQLPQQTGHIPVQQGGYAPMPGGDYGGQQMGRGNLTVPQQGFAPTPTFGGAPTFNGVAANTNEVPNLTASIPAPSGAANGRARVTVEVTPAAPPPSSQQ